MTGCLFKCGAPVPNGCFQLTITTMVNIPTKKKTGHIDMIIWNGMDWRFEIGFRVPNVDSLFLFGLAIWGRRCHRRGSPLWCSCGS